MLIHLPKTQHRNTAGEQPHVDPSIQVHRIVTKPGVAIASWVSPTSVMEESERTCTIVGSCLLPSTNSSYVSFASLSLSMLRNILSTRYIGK